MTFLLLAILTIGAVSAAENTNDTITDNEAIDAFKLLCKLEGIIPALESSHAVAYGIKLAQEHKYKKILINLSGRGDKDIEYVLEHYKK